MLYDDQEYLSLANVHCQVAVVCQHSLRQELRGRGVPVVTLFTIVVSTWTRGNASEDYFVMEMKWSIKKDW